jgi:hypothetical protein
VPLQDAVDDSQAQASATSPATSICLKPKERHLHLLLKILRNAGAIIVNCHSNMVFFLREFEK